MTRLLRHILFALVAFLESNGAIAALLIIIIAAVMLGMTGCASTFGEPRWHTDMPAYRPSLVLITSLTESDLRRACGQERPTNVACVQRFPSYAQIYVNNKLTQEQYECAMTHEIDAHIIKGMDHDDRPILRPDCGEGAK